MKDADILAALVDRSALGLTMAAEARGDWRQGNSSVEERIAVGCVARNRLPHYRSYAALEQTYKGVVLADRQFSCWMKGGGAANYQWLMQQAERIVTGQGPIDLVVEESLYLAEGIMRGLIMDRTGGATMYYAPAAMVPPSRTPNWALGKNALRIGEQLFLA